MLNGRGIILARKTKKFGKSVPDIDPEEKRHEETTYTLHTVAEKCPKLGPRRCPYMREVRGKLKCKIYTEPWKKWYQDKRCYMYDSHNWDKEEYID